VQYAFQSFQENSARVAKDSRKPVIFTQGLILDYEICLAPRFGGHLAWRGPFGVRRFERRFDVTAAAAGGIEGSTNGKGEALGQFVGKRRTQEFRNAKTESGTWSPALQMVR
jgi:hypothetical protein